MYKRPFAFRTIIGGGHMGHEILKSSSSSCRLSREIGRCNPRQSYFLAYSFSSKVRVLFLPKSKVPHREKKASSNALT
jgi:hypothetical protein